MRYVLLIYAGEANRDTSPETMAAWDQYTRTYRLVV